MNMIFICRAQNMAQGTFFVCVVRLAHLASNIQG